METEMKQMGL